MNPSLPWRAGTAPDFGREVHCLLGLPIDALDQARTVDRIRHYARLRRPCFLTTPNLNFLVASQTDAAFRKSVIDSDLSVADGMPLIWLARLLGIPISERVAGAGLVDALRRPTGESPLKIYFFGGPDGVAAAAAQALDRENGGLKCVGFESPGFGSVADMSGPSTLARINASGADFLAVSLGARKGQAWIQHNRARLAVPVVSHLGAVVNFVAGRVRRAPPWMQRVGLEWLWRIREEPALWRRYWSDGLAFARLIATRALPYAWYLRCRKPDPAALAGAGVVVRDSPDCLSLRLAGPWTRANLGRLRECLAGGQLAGRDVHLDLGAVSHVDSAVIGLLLLLQGFQARQGKLLRVGPISVPVRRILKYGCAEFLSES